ncbi:hypothetical protein ACFVYA_20065 [Amycolatopsis sp. NPDC058278]|uniref:hypothetical protein n=1 Tax=Amycolatopsis sp. NPDC058278 TaxID=3346417 RepID=UPI0036DB3E90
MADYPPPGIRHLEDLHPIGGVFLARLDATPFDPAAPRDFFNLARERDRQAAQAYDPAAAGAAVGDPRRGRVPRPGGHRRDDHPPAGRRGERQVSAVAGARLLLNAR